MRRAHTAAHRVPFGHHGCSEIGFIALPKRSRVNIDNTPSRRHHSRAYAAAHVGAHPHTASRQGSEQGDQSSAWVLTVGAHELAGEHLVRGPWVLLVQRDARGVGHEDDEI